MIANRLCDGSSACAPVGGWEAVRAAYNGKIAPRLEFLRVLLFRLLCRRSSWFLLTIRRFSKLMLLVLLVLMVLLNRRLLLFVLRN